MKNIKRYEHNKDSSAEILRMILQKMAAHPAAFIPPTYAIWYEFLAGINPPLIEEMGDLLNRNELITTEVAQALFSNYISEGSSEAHLVYQQNMQQLLDKLAQFTEDASVETNRFSSDLKKHEESLSGKVDDAQLKKMISEIMQGTHSMRSSVEVMDVRLNESKVEIQDLEKQLHHARTEALFDPLTGVYNRRGYEYQRNKLQDDADLTGKRVSILMLDIDFFKKINDTYGHMFGDKVISTIATLLKAQVKGQDVVVRMGGEEFAVILPNTNLDGAYAVAENIRKFIARSKIRKGGSQELINGITISIGIADCQIAGDWNDALGNADSALYSSKKNGRNKTTLYTNDTNSSLMRAS